MRRHNHAAVIVRIVLKGIAASHRRRAVIADQRAARPIPFVGRTVAQPDVHQLQPVVVVQVVVEVGRRAEAFAQHLPGGVVADRVGVGVRSSAQIAARVLDFAALIITYLHSSVIEVFSIIVKNLATKKIQPLL